MSERCAVTVLGLYAVTPRHPVYPPARNAELGPQGIHIAHVNLDGPIDSPETAGILLPSWDEYREKRMPQGGIMDTNAIADTYYHLHMQPRSVWSLDLDLRPWTTRAWFNS